MLGRMWCKHSSRCPARSALTTRRLRVIVTLAMSTYKHALRRIVWVLPSGWRYSTTPPEPPGEMEQNFTSTDHWPFGMPCAAPLTATFLGLLWTSASHQLRSFGNSLSISSAATATTAPCFAYAQNTVCDCNLRKLLVGPAIVTCSTTGGAKWVQSLKLPTAAFMFPAPPSVNKRSSMRLPNLYNDHYIDITTVSCVTDYGIRVALLCSSRWHSTWSWPVQYCVSKVCQRCVTNDGAV
jgi:hypothetical protein